MGWIGEEGAEEKVNVMKIEMVINISEFLVFILPPFYKVF